MGGCREAAVGGGGGGTEEARRGERGGVAGRGERAVATGFRG